MQNLKKIAVLPFRNLSVKAEDAIFADGITEEIINALAHVNGILVSSKTSSFSFQEKGYSAQHIAERLNLNYLIEGSVRICEDKVRVQANLIDAQSDFTLWSQSWNRRLTDIFSVQEEISLLVADKLREDLPGLKVEDQIFEKRPTPVDAYTLTLEAKRLFNNWNPIDVKKSIELFEKALELDPYNADAYVGLADAHGFLGTTLFADPVESWNKAKVYTDKALDLNPKHAGAYYQLANLAFFTAFDFNKAFQNTLKAIEYKPNYPEGQQFMAFLHMLSGRYPEAKKHLDIALEIDPLSAETRFYRAYYAYRLENFEEALKYTEICLRENPLNIPAYTVKAYTLLGLGRHQEAVAFAESQPPETIVPADKLGITAMAYALENNQEKFQGVFSELQAEGENDHAFQAHAYLFLIYTILDYPDKAFEWVEKSIDCKSPVILLMYGGPFTRNLHHLERYQSLAAKLFAIEESSPSAKAEKPLLDEEAAEEYLTRLLTYCEEEEPYLKPDLTLRALAHELGLGPNQLSWLINQKTQRNFNSFINRYRIAHFQELAKKPENAHISLLGLAYESGFNSKTAFNTYFKKETGLTPKEYLQEK